MSAQHYEFKIGQIECAVLLDGFSVIGSEGILRRYPDASETEIRQAFAEVGASLDEANTSFNILLAKIGDEVLLIDSGEGGHPKGGHLLAGLNQIGIVPEAITRVVITHSHGDHVLGLLTDDQRPVFLNAIYDVSKEEMDFWQSRIEGGLVDQRPILDMMEAQGLRLIDMSEPILPGLMAVPLPGHTPGQIGLLFESENQTLLHMADLLHSPMQFAHPEWSPTFDADTRVSVPTRQAALSRAADENLLTMFYHLPFPGLGRVQRAGGGFRWEAVTALA